MALINLKEMKIKKEKEKERARYHKEVIKNENKRKKEYHEAPNDSFLILKSINKIYDNHIQAVYDFNLSVQKNEFIVLVGPSGCGKSTTLRMIAGLEDITSGDLFINGEYVNYVSPKDRDIAMVFQSYALYPHMTVYDNMAFGLKIRHINKEEIDKRVREAAKTLQLSDYLERKPKALSGGQCQRVALGRAIVRNANLFLMDEPLSNLDAKLRVQMRSEIVALHQSLGATTIYVTHDQTEAMTMASRIVVMKDGYVQQIGTPIEIYDHPANVFVATFVGSPSMNILNVKLQQDTIKLSNDFELKLSKEKVELIKKHYQNDLIKYNEAIKGLQESINDNNIDPVIKESKVQELEDLNKKVAVCQRYLNNEEIETVFGIRPEDIIELKDSDNIKNASKPIDISVKVAELLGHEYFVHFKYEQYDLVSKVMLINKLIKAKDELRLVFNVDNIHLFDINDNTTLL